METLTEVQTKCERIKNTPFPKQYDMWTVTFTWVFVTLLPFDIIAAMDLFSETPLDVLVVPLVVFIGVIFLSLSRLATAYEDPFENKRDDVPISAISRQIEIELKKKIGEKQIPKPLEPVNGVLL